MMKLQMNMKINNYIKAKQHYIPPIIELLEVEEESLLGPTSIDVTGGDMDGNGNNDDIEDAKMGSFDYDGFGELEF